MLMYFLLLVYPHYDELYLAIAKNSNHYLEYKCIKGDNEEFDLTNNKLSFEFTFDYDEFERTGTIYVDGKEVSKSYYTLSKGSTIVTFKNSFANKLSSGNHTIVANLNGIDIRANYQITNTNNTSNPDTSDNIITYISLLGLSIAGLYLNKKYI